MKEEAKKLKKPSETRKLIKTAFLADLKNTSYQEKKRLNPMKHKIIILVIYFLKRTKLI